LGRKSRKIGTISLSGLRVTFSDYEITDVRWCKIRYPKQEAFLCWVEPSLPLTGLSAISSSS
jgi:hypothetical protein